MEMGIKSGPSLVPESLSDSFPKALWQDPFLISAEAISVGDSHVFLTVLLFNLYGNLLRI